MKWSTFVEGVRQCPDDELTDRFGIWDNFPILTRNLSTTEMMSALFATGRYEPHSLENDIGGGRMVRSNTHVSLTTLQECFQKQIAFKQGMVVIDPYIEVHRLKTFINSHDPRAQKFLLFQLTHYNAALKLHPYQIKQISGVSGWRVMADVIEDVTRHILIPRNVDFCLPHVFIYKSRTLEQDYSTIVYWPDSDEEEMCRP